ncbi:hypothetical protein [Candidatus Nitrospira salsa]
MQCGLPWNPAVLKQRIGRFHRLGQYRPVQGYHFIAEHTIEHDMLELLAFKQSLFPGVLQEEQEAIFLVARDSSASWIRGT